MRKGPWEEWLGKPNGLGEQQPERARQILQGIEFGVAIDYTGDRSISRFGRNLPVEKEDEPKVEKVIGADCAALKKAGPFDTAPFPVMTISPIGAVPKKGSSKIRVIHHLSYPFGGDSINASVVDEYLPLSTIDDAMDAVRRFGVGALLIKIDVQAAYKQVPVRREDWPLLGFMWKGKWYYERVLPFGLKSSCRLWDWYAAALHFFLEKHFGIEVVIHYIDDFLFVVRPAHSAQAAQHLRDCQSLCLTLGIPIADEKTEGPTTCLTFLGIELDTVAMEAHLPAAKLADLKLLVNEWHAKRHATVRELQSLVGTLSFACKVIRPGRFYLKRIIWHMARMIAHPDVKSHTKDYWILPEQTRADIRWWLDFAEEWNGIGLLYEREWSEANKIVVTTDACETGYGATCGEDFFFGKWEESHIEAARRAQKTSMPFLELHALVQAAATWGHLWAGKKVLFMTDASVGVAVIKKRTSDSPDTMQLLRLLSTLACRYRFELKAEHIPGVENIAADALSRYGDCSVFRQARPQAQQRATTPVPLQLLSAQQRAAFSRTGSQTTPGAPTRPASGGSSASAKKKESAPGGRN